MNDETMTRATEWGLSGLKQQIARRERLVTVALHSDPEQMEYKSNTRSPALRAYRMSGIGPTLSGRN